VAELIKTDVAIVGAGIIGLAIAFRLAKDGREVVVAAGVNPRFFGGTNGWVAWA
jgi:glycine/D-amino acid oxidase-like deaminating enzyme